VRAGSFDADFGRTLLAVLLPFPLPLAVVIHVAWPPFPGKRVTRTGGDLRHGTDDEDDDPR
jgi:hypothetical protein